MTIRTLLITSSIIAASLMSGATHATLLGRDLNGSVGSFEAYYDTDLNITWLADANAALGSSYDSVDGFTDGRLRWVNANTWAASLSFYNPLTNETIDNWRLPTTLQPDPSCSGQLAGFSFGFNCTGSEMGHLFYSELGGVAGQSIVTTHNSNYSLFTNVQSGFYWSGTEYDPFNPLAWYFYTGDGSQDYNLNSDSFYALAVRPGDVAAPNNGSVPEPETLALLGLGLMGMTWTRRRG